MTTCPNHRPVMISSEVITDAKYKWQEGNVIATVYIYRCLACGEIREVKFKEKLELV